MEEMRNYYSILVLKLDGRHRLGDPGIYGKIM
jgi:hypothetical protein